MHKWTLAILLAFAVVGAFAQIRSCYDIQYTTDASGDSPYTGQTVTVQGVVTVARFYTGTGANNYGFCLADPQGGAWRGLFIYNQFQFPLFGRYGAANRHSYRVLRLHRNYPGVHLSSFSARGIRCPCLCRSAQVIWLMRPLPSNGKVW